MYEAVIQNQNIIFLMNFKASDVNTYRGILIRKGFWKVLWEITARERKAGGCAVLLFETLEYVVCFVHFIKQEI